ARREPAPAELAGRDRRSDRGGPAVRRGHRAAHRGALAGLTAWAPGIGYGCDSCRHSSTDCTQIRRKGRLPGSPGGRDVELTGDGGSDQRLPPLGQEGGTVREQRPVTRVLLLRRLAVASDPPLLSYRTRRRDSQ